MENNEIKVKNITNIIRVVYHDRKIYKFESQEAKIVPESFILSSGECKYPFLKLVGFVRDDGSLMEVKKVEEVTTISDAIESIPEAEPWTEETVKPENPVEETIEEKDETVKEDVKRPKTKKKGKSANDESEDGK